MHFISYLLLYFKNSFLVNLFLALLFLHCWMGFSPVVASRGCSPAVVQGLLAAVAPLVAEHRLQGVKALVAGGPGL